MGFGGELRAGRMKVAECGDFGFADEAPGEHARVRGRGQRETAIFERQAEVVRANRKVEQPRGPELPTRPTTQRGTEAPAKVFLTELDRYTNQDRRGNDQQQDSPAAGIPSLEPVQQVQSENSSEQENAGGPHGNRSPRHKKKSSERQAQKTCREIGREPGAGHEAAAEEKPGAFLGEPLFAPCDSGGIQESLRP